MLCTEKQAKEKRCSFSLVLLTLDPERYNALGTRDDGFGAVHCIGSECMQWNWFDYANAQGMTYFSPDALPSAKGRSTNAGVSTIEKPARGFCGMTGTRE